VTSPHEPTGETGRLRSRGGDRATFLYIQARLRARLAQRLRGADYERFLGMTLDQVAHAISEAAYGEEARALGMTLSGGALLREMARRKLSSEIAALIRMCGEGAPAEWLRAWRWRYDLVLLRAALRARGRWEALPGSTMIELLAQLPLAAYEQLARSGPASSAAAPFMNSPFRATLELAASDTPPDTEVLEAGLLHNFYDTVLSRLSRATSRRDPTQRVIEDQVHYVNLLTVLAARAEGTSPETALAQIVGRGFWRQESLVRGLLEASEAELSGRLATLGRRGELGSLDLPATPEVTAGLLERAAVRSLLSQAFQAARCSLPTPAALTGYLTVIECEARNLVALVLADEGGLERADRRAMLVA
jgi:vacuolar-type H+-ATPase subunit C/Vma6